MFHRNDALFVAVAVAGSLVGGRAAAEHVTVRVTGTVYEVDDGSNVLQGAVQLGQEVVAGYSFESTTPDSDAATLRGYYRQIVPATGMEIAFGGWVVSAISDPQSYRLEIQDEFGMDRYSVVSTSNWTTPSGVPIPIAQIDLSDPAGRALSSDALPGGAPNFADWRSGLIGIQSDSPRVIVVANVESIVLASEFEARRGNVNANGSGVLDVLRANQSAGDGMARESIVSPTSRLILTMDLPPAHGMSHSARYALFAWAGKPSDSTLRTTPAGNVCMPLPFQNPGVFLRPIEIWNNIGQVAQLGSPTRPSSPAPGVVDDLTQGVGHEGVFFLQGVIRDGSSPVGFSITNGIVLRIQ